MANLSRRLFLKTSTLAGVGAVGIFNSFYGFNKVLGQDMAENNDTATIINVAATAELFATTHYLAAINNAAALELSPEEVAYMQAGFLAEQDHFELLTSLGAVPLFTEFYVPETLFADRALFSATTETAETVFIAAYLAAVRTWAEGGAATAPFAVTAAQILATEAEHRAFARDLGNRPSSNQSYAQYLFLNVSDAATPLLPFLDGSGEGFVGPIAPPTADDIAGVRAQIANIGYDNLGVPFAAMDLSMLGS